MPITLSQPITLTVNEVGDTFVVESCKLDFAKKRGEFFWRIKSQTGRVLKQGVVVLEDSKTEQEFTEWYNSVYTSHADLVNMVASGAGYAGVFKEAGLI